MATPVSVIYRKFLNQIDDVEFALITNEVLEELMYDYLENSIIEFRECKKQLTLVPSDGTNEAYIDNDLTTEEIFILAQGMVLNWLQPKIKREENLRQMFGDRDFSMGSSANMLGKLITLDDLTRRNLLIYKRRYSLNNFQGLS